MSSDDMDIHVRLKGARAAAGDAKAVRREVTGVGSAAERAGRKSRVLGKGAGFARGKMLGLGKAVIGAGAAFASFEGIKTAVEQTDLLAQTTLRLTKNTAFDVQTASEWAAVAKVRGIDASRLGMTLAKLSKTVEGGKSGQKTSVQLWKDLGVSHSDLLHSGKDMPGFIGKIADRFKALGPGTKRTAIAQALFGRSWQTLIPILRDGSGELDKQLGMAKKYGAALGEGGLKTTEDFIKKQREAQFAILGFQVTLGTTVIPVLTKALGWFTKLTLGFRHGTGEGGKLRDQLERIWKAAKPVVLWFGRAAKNIIAFVSKRPELVKVAASLFLAQKALKLMRFGSAISGVQTLAGWLGRAETRATAMPGKVAASGGKWAMAGKLVGGFFTAAFLLNLPGVQDLIDKITGGGLSPKDVPGPRTKAGPVVGHVTRDGIRYEVRREGGLKYGQKSYWPIANIDRHGPINPHKVPQRHSPRWHGTPHHSFDTGRPGLNPQRNVDRGPRGPLGPGSHHGPGARPKLATAGEETHVHHHVFQVNGKTLFEAFTEEDRKKKNRR